MGKSEKYLARLEEINQLPIYSAELIVGHAPKASKRPRKGKFGFYVPDAAANKKEIRKLIEGQLPADYEKAYSEVEIFIKCYVKTPSGFSKLDKELAEDGYIRPIAKPDLDNYMKTYLDAFNDLLWLDDGQITNSGISKYYSDEPRVEICIICKKGYTCKYIERAQLKKVK